MIHLPLLLITLLLALGQAMLTGVVLHLGWPPIAQTGLLFGSAMLLVFAALIGIGLTMPATRLADYVRRYFGKTLALALGASLLLGALGVGAEALYQAPPIERAATQTVSTANVCFVMDYSSSMNANYTPGQPDYHAAICDAFAEALAQMPTGASVSVVHYASSAEVFLPWTAIGDANQAVLDGAVAKSREKLANGGTNFADALSATQQLAAESSGSCAVVFLSDGEGQLTAASLTYFLEHQVPIDVVFAGDGDVPASLAIMAGQTGGNVYHSGDSIELTRITAQALTERAQSAELVSDTLFTRRGANGHLLPPAARLPLLFLLGFGVQFVGIIMMARNDRLSRHALQSALAGLLGALALEGLSRLNVPSALPIAAYWVLVMALVGRMEPALTAADEPSDYDFDF